MHNYTEIWPIKFTAIFLRNLIRTHKPGNQDTIALSSLKKFEKNQNVSGSDKAIFEKT